MTSVSAWTFTIGSGFTRFVSRRCASAATTSPCSSSTACGDFNRELGREITEVAPEALARLREHSWPGNVRELQSVLKQALLRAAGSVLLPAFLSELSERSPCARAGAGTFDLDAFIRDRLTPEASDVYAETLGQVDRLLFTRALEFTQGNHRDAARVLGISRQTMRVKMRALGLHVARSVESDDDA